ncbi:cell wall hydrolase [Cohaesibacter celericrescens]|nr:cell wall hydrolase [Cohaesibacter celericrescens]
MSASELVGVGLLGVAAFYGLKAYRQSQMNGVAVAAVPVTSAPAVSSGLSMPSFDLSWLSGAMDWTGSFVPAANASTTPISEVFDMPTSTATVSHDVLTLARTIYGEARSETQAGKEAVASVVLNRVKSPRWGSTIATVCLQPWQFSCWNVNDPNYPVIKDLQPRSSIAFDLCLSIAKRAASGQLRDNTNGADHYHANYIGSPSWLKASPNAVMTVQYGAHKFYRGIA